MTEKLWDMLMEWFDDMEDLGLFSIWSLEKCRALCKQYEEVALIYVKYLNLEAVE